MYATNKSDFVCKKEYLMGSKKEVMDHILAQLEGLGEVSAKKMFGEYGVYYKGKMIALVCDDQLFIKPNSAAEAYMGDFETAPPYPGAKDWFLVSEEMWDDPLWLCELFRITEPEVAEPKPKKKRVMK